MKNFVISLTTATQRREHITQEFSKQNIPFEFFDAITPDTMVQACERLNIDLINNQRLSGGEKGCFLSHVILWQKMLDENLDYIAIFEDDIYLGENAQVFFNDENWLKNNQIDFIKTETFLQKRKLGSESILLVDNRSAKPLKEYHLGTAGYIISPTTALSLFNFIKTLDLANEYFAIDQLMFDRYMQIKDSLPIYQLFPAIVSQEFILYPSQNAMPSDIKNAREQRVKPKRTLSQKLKGELSNAYRKTFGNLSRELIEFR